MITYLEYYIGSISLWIAAYLAGCELYECKCTGHFMYKIFIITLFSNILVVLNLVDFEVFYGTVKILTIYLLLCIFYNLLFRKTASQIVITSLIWYLLLFISEIFVVMIIGIITYLLGTNMQFIKNNVIVNCIISSVNIIIIYFNKAKIKKLINDGIRLKSVIPITVILITLALLVFRIPFSEWKINTEFIITMLTLLCFCFVAMYLLKQKSDIEKTTSMYQHVVQYSNTTNKLLEDYRMIGHEHKNQLSIIRQMVHKDNIELIEYLDSLIEKRKDIKYKWVAELNKLPLEGLKGLINYKLIEAEEKGIKISVLISKEVSKVKLNKLSTIEKDHLYSISGVYLDNAIQAASKSKDKEIGIQVYKENKELVFILSNTFSGKVDIDKLDDYGYSTKGKNHGVGLHIVKTIIDEDKLYSQSRKIIDNYYVQELRTNIYGLNRKKK